MEVRIREIEPKDDQAVEAIIRDCLKEYGGDHAGTAWCDPDLGRFSQIYGRPEMRYWVAEDENGKILGGAGYGPLEGNICELQKMYTLPQARGTGIAHLLIQTVLKEAAEQYEQCYLETFSNMVAAQKFYEKYGFQRIDHFIGSTGHVACDAKYIKDFE
ncbi:GNAT family N-acetyltransferase [Erysipelotrichaceae bacterium RD49]|nr:GNAT family N-acetyltransferase [Erysipelotrichaceae bacterium RD49]